MSDELILGEDYYIENGNWVFTARFLLKRGYCCRSGCRHCPYGYVRGQDEEQPSGRGNQVPKTPSS